VACPAATQSPSDRFGALCGQLLWALLGGPVGSVLGAGFGWVARFGSAGLCFGSKGRFRMVGRLG